MVPFTLRLALPLEVVGVNGDCERSGFFEKATYIFMVPFTLRLSTGSRRGEWGFRKVGIGIF